MKKTKTSDKPDFMTEAEFYREIEKIPGVSKKMTDSGLVYTLDKKVIKKFLQDTNNYDPCARLF